MKHMFIPDWNKKKSRCHFCGTNKSVKYKTYVMDPVVGSKPTEVCVCNRCITAI